MIFTKLFFVACLFMFCNADIYLHNPRGSNNRLNEKSAARTNANRVFDSQVRTLWYQSRIQRVCDLLNVLDLESLKIQKNSFSVLSVCLIWFAFAGEFLDVGHLKKHTYIKFT